jgi:hypothetical protein
MHSRVRSLEGQLKYPLPSNLQKEYEAIDNFRMAAVTQAEHKCRKLRMGQVSFSPILATARLLIKIWSLLEKKAKGMKISLRLLKRSLHKTSIDASARSFSLCQIQEELKDAYTNYYNLKSHHVQLRQTALDE